MAGCPAWSAAPFAHAYRQPTRIASPRVSPAHAYRQPTNALAPISISLMSATLSLPRTKRTSEPKVVSNSISQNSFMRSLQSLSQCSRSSSTDVDSEPRCLPDTPVPAPSLTTAREARALPKRSTGSDSVRAYAQRVDDVVKLIDQKDQAATAAVGKLLGQAAQKDLVLESQARHANHHAAVVSTALRARFRAVSVTARHGPGRVTRAGAPAHPLVMGGSSWLSFRAATASEKSAKRRVTWRGCPPPLPPIYGWRQAVSALDDSACAVGSDGQTHKVRQLVHRRERASGGRLDAVDMPVHHGLQSDPVAARIAHTGHSEMSM